jgi:hypothetical protein
MGICGSLGAYMFYGLFASVSWATVWEQCIDVYCGNVNS